MPTERLMSPRGRLLPMPEGHSAIGHPCDLCSEPIRPGDIVTVLDEGDNSYFDTTVPPFSRGLSTRDTPPVLAHESCAYPEGA